MRKLAILFLAISFAQCDEKRSTDIDKNFRDYQNELSEKLTLEEVIATTDSTIMKLRLLKDKEKFMPVPNGYVGILPPENQPAANQLLNRSIQNIINMITVDTVVSKSLILNEFRRGLISMEGLVSDTEDRERLCEYYSEIREIIGFETTNNLLNDWLYRHFKLKESY